MSSDGDETCRQGGVLSVVTECLHPWHGICHLPPTAMHISLLVSSSAPAVLYRASVCARLDRSPKRDFKTQRDSNNCDSCMSQFSLLNNPINLADIKLPADVSECSPPRMSSTPVCRSVADCCSELDSHLRFDLQVLPYANTLTWIFTFRYSRTVRLSFSKRYSSERSILPVFMSSASSIASPRKRSLSYRKRQCASCNFLNKTGPHLQSIALTLKKTAEPKTAPVNSQCAPLGCDLCGDDKTKLTSLSVTKVMLLPSCHTKLHTLGMRHSLVRCSTDSRPWNHIARRVDQGCVWSDVHDTQVALSATKTRGARSTERLKEAGPAPTFFVIPRIHLTSNNASLVGALSRRAP